MVRILVVLSLFLASAPAAAQTRIASLAWMAGTWVHEDARQRVTEGWIGPGNGTMLGTNLTARADGRALFEFMRMAETPEGVSYYASPAGRPAVEFRAKEVGESRVVFENLTHDFPQRVIYWKEGEVLAARIEGTMRGKERSEEWRFKPAR